MPIIAGILSGTVGAMGLGGGSVLIIYLTAVGVERITAQGINLLFFIPTAITAAAIYLFKKQIDIKASLIFAAGGVFGAIVGGYLAGHLGGNALRPIFAVSLIIYGGYEFFAGITAKKTDSPKNTESRRIKSKY